MHKAPYVFPLVGGRKVEHLQDNIKALSISLTDKQIKFLESQVPFDPGFPHTMIVSVHPQAYRPINSLAEHFLGRRLRCQCFHSLQCSDRRCA